jgi:GNAT superfamily N-acetyltransferase
MNIHSFIELTSTHKPQLLELWNNEYPVELGYKSLSDFENYLNNLESPSHHFLADNEGNIKGWYFDFNRDSEKWFGIIVESSLHGKGLGRSLLNYAKSKEPELNGWVIDHQNSQRKDGQLYQSPLEFYKKQGFEVHCDIRLELPEISAVKIHWRK